MNLVDARRTVTYCNSYTRLPTIVELHANGLSRARTLRVLGEEWDGCDNVGEYLDEMGEILTFPPCAQMMTTKERATLAALPELVTIYRGADRDVNVEGLCWSLDRAVAARFPFYMRYRATDPVLVVATVKRRHIIAVKLGRKESEVLTWCAAVQSIEGLTQPAVDGTTA